MTYGLTRASSRHPYANLLLVQQAALSPQLGDKHKKTFGLQLLYYSFHIADEPYTISLIGLIMTEVQPSVSCNNPSLHPNDNTAKCLS